MLSGCGGGDKGGAAGDASAGKHLTGQSSDSGMVMTVDTFVPPSKDAALGELEKYRAAGHFPAVDYHRVVADNTKGQLDDRAQPITFARSQSAILSGQDAPSAFACNKLHYEWIPADNASAATKTTYKDLISKFCAVDPQNAAGIPKGTKKTYYLVTDRGFGQRGIATMKVFGPRSVELK
jgi:hypothetical protein